MSLETMIGGLSHEEKILAMEILWKDLIESSPEYASPQWHADVIAERLENPASAKRLNLLDSRSEIKAERNDRRTQD